MNYPSKLLEAAIQQFNQLPGIGKKTALRLALHLLKKDIKEIELFGNTFINFRNNVQYCQTCHNISETAICSICANPKRDKELICVVEDIRDVLAIENTSQFNGLYHVLGGIISPMDGIGPKDLNIESLVARVQQENTREIILALSTTMEGDTTNFYIFKKLKDIPVSISTIARGIAVGDELEYADEVTLGRSILHRTPYEKSISNSK